MLMNTIAHTRVLMNPTDMHRFHKLLVICSCNGFLFLEPLAYLLILLIIYVLCLLCTFVNMNENPPL